MGQFQPFLIILISVSLTSWIDTVKGVEVTICETGTKKPLVPALFILGDSILDAGNNNGMLTLAKVDYYPYGMDFVGGAPSGRFSNGYTASDFIALKLGLPLIPAYNHPGTKGKKILQGVNFASGGSGINSNTGKLYGQVVSLEEQIENLQKTKEQIIGLIGKVATDELFAKSPFVVVTGSNDWLLSYFNPLLPYIHLSSLTIDEHRDKLVQKLISHIKAIHEVGGRRIVVAGVPALGCCPSQLLAYQSNGSCVDYINDVSKDYNEHLLPEILSLNEKIPNATIMYINIYTSILNAAQHPTQFGFKTGNTACCGIGKYNGFLTCLRGLKPCDNVEDHFYWDAYHPTSKFYPQLIDVLWNNGPPYTYPKSLQEEFQPMKQQDNVHTEL